MSQRNIMDYLLTSGFMHLAVMLGLLYTPVFNTSGGADKIDIKIIEKEKTPATVLLPPSPPKYAKSRRPIDTKEKGPKPGKPNPQIESGLTEIPAIELTNYADQLKSVVDPVWYAKIMPIMSRIPHGTQTNVLLFLDKYGTVLSVKVIKSSGIREVDQIAIETFWSIGSLPKPPEKLVKEGIIWDFGLGEG